MVATAAQRVSQQDHLRRALAESTTAIDKINERVLLVCLSLCV